MTLFENYLRMKYPDTGLWWYMKSIYPYSFLSIVCLCLCQCVCVCLYACEHARRHCIRLGWAYFPRYSVRLNPASDILPQAERYDEGWGYRPLYEGCRLRFEMKSYLTHQTPCDSPHLPHPLPGMPPYLGGACAAATVGVEITISCPLLRFF